MKNKKIFLLASLVAVCLASMFISACNKKFDEPDVYPDPNIPVTMTLKELKALHVSSGAVELITVDKVVSGIIVADDKSGSFYQSISIQDATGGISVRIAGGSNYTNYPVGRKVYLKVKGLCIGDYGKLVQIGAVDNTVLPTIAQVPIPANLFDVYIIKGGFGNIVTPRVVTLAQLSTPSIQDSIQSTLIQLQGYEFPDTTKTYADPTQAASAVNHDIKNCTNSITLRNSSYANFAAIKVPKGNGSITAIYTFFNNTKQLVIRDTNDVKFYAPRCGGNNLQTIAAVRAMYTSSNVTLGAMQISGTIISDAASKNMSAGNMVIQDGTAGIDLYFGTSAATTNFNIGDSVTVDLTGGILQSFNGLIEIGLSTAQLPATKIATGKTVTPIVLTTAQFNVQIATIECRLVKIVAATATPVGTYVGTKILTDAAGTATLFTSTNATFGGQTLPTVSSDWVGYGTRVTTTNQFNIRNLNDVTASSGPPPTGSGIILTTSPVTLDFNAIESSGLPAGVTIFTLATSTSFGTAATLAPTKALWAATGGGFKNFASATGLTATSDQTAQDGSSNRALGIRPVTATDMGNSFVFQIDNTTAKTNLAMSFLLQSLDNTIGRTATWTVDYATGTAPTSFTTIATTPALLAIGPIFASTPVTVNFGSALNNISTKVWIRISSLSATSGSGSRPSTGIDDVKFTWQ